MGVHGTPVPGPTDIRSGRCPPNHSPLISCCEDIWLNLTIWARSKILAPIPMCPVCHPWSQEMKGKKKRSLLITIRQNETNQSPSPSKHLLV